MVPVTGHSSPRVLTTPSLLTGGEATVIRRRNLLGRIYWHIRWGLAMYSSVMIAVLLR